MQENNFNQVPCDSGFELDFAKFLDNAHDVTRFAKLPMNFGFSIPYTENTGNLRYYYPDFVVVDEDGLNYLVETKGREDVNVRNKDRAAVMWCERASQLTGNEWHYVKVMQDKYTQLQPTDFADCVYIMENSQLSLFDEDEG